MKPISMSFALLFGCFILAGSRVEASGLLHGITVLDPGSVHGLLLNSTLKNHGQVAGDLLNDPGTDGSRRVPYYYDSQAGGKVTDLGAPDPGVNPLRANDDSGSSGR